MIIAVFATLALSLHDLERLDHLHDLVSLTVLIQLIHKLQQVKVQLLQRVLVLTGCQPSDTQTAQALRLRRRWSLLASLTNADRVTSIPAYLIEEPLINRAVKLSRHSLIKVVTYRCPDPALDSSLCCLDWLPIALF